MNLLLQTLERYSVQRLGRRLAESYLTHRALNVLFHLCCVRRHFLHGNSSMSLRKVMASWMQGVWSFLPTLLPLLRKLPQSGLPMRFPGDVVSFRVVQDDFQCTPEAHAVLLQHGRNQRLGLRKGQGWTFFLNCSRSRCRNNCAKKINSM